MVLVASLQSEEVAIPAELLVGTCKSLFAFIAERVVAFTGRNAAGSLGFTFSFACAQTALDAGTLLGWTKGFALVDGVGSDVVGMLRAALADAGSHLVVAALVNDTVGTLAAARYADPLACVSVILGTGARVNAAVVARLLACAALTRSNCCRRNECGVPGAAVAYQQAASAGAALHAHDCEHRVGRLQGALAAAAAG